MIDQRPIVFFDLETQHSFDEVGGRHNLHKLGISVAVTYNTADKRYKPYTEASIGYLIDELKSADLVVGFNLFDFDYQVLRGYTDEPLQRLPTLDMLREIHRALGFRVGLGSLAEATLGVGKLADGLQAIRWWREGKIEELIAYCKQDVEVTRQLYEFGKQHKYLQFRDKRYRLQRVAVHW
jgi:DEAD/DEAH box helicase domain-containing protein